MVSDILSLAVPLLALFCNVFLFLTFIRVKKTRLIFSFLLMLTSFILWTAGSLLLRLDVYPGGLFWFQVSSFGIFLVPYLIYNFFYCYTDQRGSFARILWGLLWAVLIVLGGLGFFFTNVKITSANNVSSFTYDVT